MKMILAFCILLTSSAFSLDILPPREYLPKDPLLPVDPPYFLYLQMSTVNDLSAPLVPGIGLGMRIPSGADALDISTNINYTDLHSSSFFYTFPKVNYLRYASQENASMYLGGGMAWGGVISSDKKFQGLIANATIGYEMNRFSKVRSFVQIDISQPTIAAWRKYQFPTPFAELSVGAGF